MNTHGTNDFAMPQTTNKPSAPICPRCKKTMKCQETLQMTSQGIRKMLLCTCDECQYSRLIVVPSETSETQ